MASSYSKAKGKDVKAIVQANDISKRELNRITKEAQKVAKKEVLEFNRMNTTPLLKQRMIQLYVSGLYSKKEIASILRISYSTLSKLLRQDDVLEAIIEYQDLEKKEIDTKIKALRNKAVDTMEELMESDDDNIRLSASKDILDRTGMREKEDKNININVSYEQQLQDLVDGIIIDVE